MGTTRSQPLRTCPRAAPSPVRLFDGSGDTRDVYRFDSGLAGVLTVDLTLPEGVAPGNLVLVIRDAAGQEIARIAPADGARSVSVNVPAGATFLSLESLAGAASYSLATRLKQADVAMGSVSPMAGPPGTVVTINGSGFSTRLGDNQVFFSAIPADVIAATATQLQVGVPANAVNGTVEVISGDRQAQVAGFVTGTGDSASGCLRAAGKSCERARGIPTTGAALDMNRLVVGASAVQASQADVGALAARLGGTVVGYVPVAGIYILEFESGPEFDVTLAGTFAPIRWSATSNRAATLR